jgi:hypothetical protein
MRDFTESNSVKRINHTSESEDSRNRCLLYAACGTGFALKINREVYLRKRHRTSALRAALKKSRRYLRRKEAIRFAFKPIGVPLRR